MIPQPALSRASVDRAAHRRTDTGWLDAAWRSASVLRLGPDGTVLVEGGDDDPRLALVTSEETPEPADRFFLGEDGERCYFATVTAAPPEQGVGLRQVGALLDDRDAGLLVTAVALANWHRTHTHCPRCGAPTVLTGGGWLRTCPTDGSEHYPRVDPAVIMLVHDGSDRCLLGRQASWPEGRFSTLAGFVEPGESAEHAVAREVAEETGVVVEEIHYTASQPWPFPSSLMLGFSARAVSADPPRLLDGELAEARWFSRAELIGEAGPHLPPPVSVAHRLITAWVLGLERYGPAHALGASHGGSRIIRLAYYEDPSYVPLLRTAYDLWAGLEAETGQSLLSRCGALFLGPPDRQVFAGTLRAARQHGLDHEVLGAAEVRRRYPVLAPDDAMRAVHEDVAGIVSPESAVQAHLHLAGRHGADLRFFTPVDSWAADGSGVVVHTADGSHPAQRLILTPGAWAADLVGLPDLPLRVERRLQLWFTPAARPAAFAALPVWMWERADGLVFYGLPLREGAAKVAIHNRGDPCDGDTVDRSVHPDEVAHMRAVLQDSVPDLAAGRLARASVCTYTLTPDQHFVVGAHAEHPQVAIACGFSGHGFKFAPVIGEVLADIALDGRTRHPIGLFNPGRY